MALQAQLEALKTFLSTTSTSTTTTTTTIPTTTTTTVTTITTTTTVTTVTTTTVGEHTVKTAFFAGLCNEGAGGASRLIGENIKGNTKKWSYSAWYKRTDTTYNAGSSSVHSGEWETLFGAGQQSGSKPHEHLFLYNEMNDFGSSQRYYSHNDGNANEGDVAWKFADSGNYEFGVTYKTRDIIGPQATQTNTRWHHVLFVADTEQSDASKRMTMYIDGTKVELSDSAPMGRGGSSADWRNNWFPDKGMTTGVLSGNPLLIGDFDRFSADGGRNWCFSYHGHIAGGIHGFDPPHADYLHLVKPRFGRLLVIDGSRMHGNLAAPRNIPGKPRRYVIGICFYKQRPTLRGLGNVPEFVKHGPRGARAHMPVFALPAGMQAGGGAGSTGNGVHLERTRYAGAVAAASAAAVGSGAASALSTASSHSAGGVLKMPVLSPGTSPNSNKTPRFLAMASQTSGWQSVAVDIKVPGARKVLQVRLPLPDSAGLRACEYCSVMFHDAPFADSAGSANIDGGATHSNRNRVNLHFEGRTVPSSQSRMRNYSPATDVEADTLSLKLRRAKRLERTLQEREVLQKEKGLRGDAAVAARLQPAGERDASEF